ncbi:DUF123 domain-containing protein [Methanomicrobium antiquum]|uniref:DUF123 domain-containing protein n=1 Tax=Methanomicrobium antiquum TaxID=487686 RepID=A0AAF0JMK9_9EURY|nr:DUF123 domain-containing protein [Methanomicrobium antiquum]WFN38004.1 DUF123 domain-containing protein [Methanomicrobium antiquum]
MKQTGIYFLVFENSYAEVLTGALGFLGFQEGFHVYVGSALGNSGIKRVRRHFLLSEKKDKKERWHVDYLLKSSEFNLEYAVFLNTSEKYECRAAGMLGGDCVIGFGCSDCKCLSHLYFRKSDPLNELKQISADLGLNLQIIDTKTFLKSEC